MKRILFLVAACLVCTPLAAGEPAGDFVPGILKYFPGKWLVKDANGADLGTVEFKTVAGGKAVAGPGTFPAGQKSFAMAGWDAQGKKWVHVWFDADGVYGRIEVVKFENNIYSGPMCVVDKDGKAVSGEFRNRIVDKDHCEITNVLDGKTVVMHFHRVKDQGSKR